MISELANHLWQSTLFAFAVGLLTVMCRKNCASVRHRLWLTASVKFFIPFTLLMALGDWLEWPSNAAQEIAAPAVSAALAQVSRPFDEGAVIEGLSFQETSRSSHWLALASLGAWVSGIIAMTLVRFRMWRQIRAAVRASSHWAVPGLPVPAGVDTRSNAGLMEPCVVGLWRPVLLVPAGIEDDLTPRQLGAVLEHELCHIRRRDNLTAAVHMLAEAVFWFHPLVWWIGSRLVDERERACDEEVVRTFGEPQIYAEGIVNVCKRYIESPMACLSGVGGSNVKNRIRDIMTNRAAVQLSVAQKAVLTSVGAMVLVAPILAQSVPLPTFEVASIRQNNPGQGTIAAGRVSALPVAAFAPASLPLLQIQAPPRQSFEVASVKPNKSGETTSFLQTRPGGNFAVGNMTLRGLIFFAYGIQGLQLVGGPDWIATERFDITAKAAADVPPTPIGRTSPEALMLRSLLEDRFRLSAHRETRDLPIYALVLARADGRLGPRLRQTTSDYCAKRLEAAGKAAEPIPPGGPVCGIRPSVNELTAGAFPMNEFVRFLALESGRLVVDRTGLTGVWDWDLKYSPLNAPNPDPDRPSIFTALQEQLGLRLEATTGPVEVLVIDRVEGLIPD